MYTEGNTVTLIYTLAHRQVSLAHKKKTKNRVRQSQKLALHVHLKPKEAESGGETPPGSLKAKNTFSLKARRVTQREN